MQAEQPPKAPRPPRGRPYTLILWLLFLGVLISLGSNIRQDRQISRLMQDLDAVRQQSQSQIAAMREAQSASLEQDLLRLDQLTTQLAKANEDGRQEVTAATNKMRSEFARTVEQRHQEMITAISDLRADLRSAAKGNQVNDPPKPIAEPLPATPKVSNLGASGIESSATPQTTGASEGKAPGEQSSEAATPKRRFWSKLNPFSRSRNKPQESAPQNTPAGAQASVTPSQ